MASTQEKATYLVVGASGTIGSAVVRMLAERASKVVLHYSRNRHAVEVLQTELARSGVSGAIVQSDLESEDACGHFCQKVMDELGAPFGLALCGGRVPWRDWQDSTDTDWAGAFFEHCYAPISVTRALVTHMRERRSGRVVYLSSIAAKYGGSPKTMHYAAAKAALEAAMLGLSRVVAENGVCINGVRSGFVLSPQQESGRSPVEIAERIAKIPMLRSGKPEEVAAAIEFLLSEKAGFVTGEVLTVAGGD